MDTIAILLSFLGLCWLTLMAFQASTTTLAEHFHIGKRQRDNESARQSTVVERASQLYSETFRHQPIASSWRTLLVADVVQESADCRSLLLIDPSGDKLGSFFPGQHLLIEHASIDYPPLRRCYSLSLEPGTGYYRITVKQNAEGTLETSLSKRLTQLVRKGDLLRAKGPQGRFVVSEAGDAPIVLLAAGIGVTPMFSMAAALLKEQDPRKIHFLYQVRDLEHAPLLDELRELAVAHPNFHLLVFISRGARPNTPGIHLLAGRFGGKEIHQIVRNSTPYFFLCGPNTWMKDQQNQLTVLGHNPEHIHWESFGDSSAPPPIATQPLSSATSNSVRYPVVLEQSQRSFDLAADQTLLQSLEELEVPIDAGCRTGNCGSCVTKLLRGKVRYTRTPGCSLATNEIPLCVACPDSPVQLDL